MKNAVATVIVLAGFLSTSPARSAPQDAAPPIDADMLDIDASPDQGASSGETGGLGGAGGAGASAGSASSGCAVGGQVGGHGAGSGAAVGLGLLATRRRGRRPRR